jgi:hypothetical protein
MIGSFKGKRRAKPAASSQLSGKVAFSPEALSKSFGDVAITRQLHLSSPAKAPSQLCDDVAFSPAAPDSLS